MTSAGVSRLLALYWPFPSPPAPVSLLVSSTNPIRDTRPVILAGPLSHDDPHRILCVCIANNMALGNLPLLSQLHISSTYDRRGLAALLAHSLTPLSQTWTTSRSCLALTATARATCSWTRPHPRSRPRSQCGCGASTRFEGVGSVRRHDTLGRILGSAAALDVLTVDLGSVD
jgi:hypothetical protein